MKAVSFVIPGMRFLSLVPGVCIGKGRLPASIFYLGGLPAFL